MRGEFAGVKSEITKGFFVERSELRRPNSPKSRWPNQPWSVSSSS